MERDGMQRDGARCSERCSGASARDFSLLERLLREMAAPPACRVAARWSASPTCLIFVAEIFVTASRRASLSRSKSCRREPPTERRSHQSMARAGQSHHPPVHGHAISLSPLSNRLATVTLARSLALTLARPRV